jgi:hypothetical protein
VRRISIVCGMRIRFLAVVRIRITFPLVAQRGVACARRRAEQLGALLNAPIGRDDVGAHMLRQNRHQIDLVGLGGNLAALVDLADPVEHMLQLEARHGQRRAHLADERRELGRRRHLADDVQRRRQLGRARMPRLARFAPRPEIRLEPVEQGLELGRRSPEVRGRHDDHLVGVVEQLADLLHVVVLHALVVL